MTMRKLENAIRIVEGLALHDQKLLRSLLSDVLYKKKSVHVLRKGEDPEGLVSSGLVVLLDDPAGLVLSPDYSDVARKICTYLTRRNESEHYFDPERGTVEIPKGSHFVATVSISGKSELAIEFPDDEITALLDQYGANRCRKVAE